MAERAVILGAIALFAMQTAPAQTAQKRKSDKGPRAVGLVHLAPNGKAYLIPVVIMLNGEFYDAGAYKAAPVPMALESGVVYEGEKSGVSQGFFTVRGALQGPNNTWKAEGTWLPEGAKPANAPHKAENKPRDIEPEDGPPVLRRKDAEAPKAAEPEAQPAAPSPSASPAPAASAPATKPPDAAPPVVASAPPPPQPEEKDPNIPVLRRGKPAPAPPERIPSGTTPAKSASTKTGSPKTASGGPGPAAKASADAMQVIPAISDAGGPEPRPYLFSSIKPADEQALRKKVLEMAAAEVQTRARQISAATMGAPATSQRKTPAKPAQPQFEDIQLRIFDLSTNNEPVAVLTASARLPQPGAPDVQYLLTLVARQDIYGDLHKAFSAVTDTQHLDVLPRMELIDAVDVDGDGRGELLFRKTSDVGSAFAVYRVIGEQLWPLFEGTPGS
jgi:hypothetical protein